MTYTPRIGKNDIERYARMSILEEECRAEGFNYIAGLDEAGRGPLAGPVAAAACILDPEKAIYGLNDSKKLSEQKREYLAEIIKEQALGYSVVLIEPAIIDEQNILEATILAMCQAVEQLQLAADILLLDAIQLPQLSIPQRSIMQGDAKVNAIAAASILAKTSRDAYMREQANIYPHYCFENNKGYGTKEHYAALEKYGPCPIHRLSFLHKLKLGESLESSKELSTRERGQAYERAVAEHLEAQNFTILEENFFLQGFAEIDLIAERDEFIYFIEVKARKLQQEISQQEQFSRSLDMRKRCKIKALSRYYLVSREVNKKAILLLAEVCLNTNLQIEHIMYKSFA